jgi:phenol 2-monooxygenase
MMVQYVDVLICGSGSASICDAIWPARLGINFKVLKKNCGPMLIGQADGVQCCTIKFFEGFGLFKKILYSAYHVL